MYHDLRVIALVPAHNEEGKIGRVVERTDPTLVDEILVIDDASSDATAGIAREKGAKVLSLPTLSGVGTALREGFRYARTHGYDVAVVMAGNNKDDPSEIQSLLRPIHEDHADIVVGSRYAPGGVCGGAMPLYRKLATRLHPWLMSWITGKTLTESTNGFRAIRLSMLDDARINLDQRWLDTYGLEVYLLWAALKCGYRHAEVPCTKIYPLRSSGFTKMKPIVGWWSILRPILFLGSGLRH